MTTRKLTSLHPPTLFRLYQLLVCSIMCVDVRLCHVVTYVASCDSHHSQGTEPPWLYHLSAQLPGSLLPTPSCHQSLPLHYSSIISRMLRKKLLKSIPFGPPISVRECGYRISLLPELHVYLAPWSLSFLCPYTPSPTTITLIPRIGSRYHCVGILQNSQLPFSQ